MLRNPPSSSVLRRFRRASTSAARAACLLRPHRPQSPPPSSSLRRRCASTYVAAIDQGTSSTRTILYDAQTLRPVSSSSYDLTSATSTPHPGWSSLNPDDVLRSVEESARDAMVGTGASPSDIAGVGITNQRESVVVWDRVTGEALTDVVLWHDARTRDTVSSLKERWNDDVDLLRPSTGLPLSTYFTGVKLRWILDNVPAAKKKIEDGSACVGTVDAFLTHRLTDGRVHVTDVTNASRTMLMDLRTCAWSTEAMDLLGLTALKSEGILPEIVPCASDHGIIERGALKGIKLTGLVGDQQSAMIGQRCFEPGMAKVTYGTGAFALMNVGREPYPSEHGLLTTALYSPPHSLDPSRMTYALEGSVGSCAVGINWFRDKLSMIRRSPEITDLARVAYETGGSKGLYFVSSFGGLLAPYWRDDSRGSLVGMTLAHDRTHVSLAVLEGIAFQVRAVAESMVADTGGTHGVTEVRVDGGVSLSDVLLQSQADFMNVNVARPQNVETTASGCAIVTGAGAGLWETYEDAPGGVGEKNDEEKNDEDETTAATTTTNADTVFEPRITKEERDARWESWNSAVESSLGWAGRK